MVRVYTTSLILGVIIMIGSMGCGKAAMDDAAFYISTKGNNH